MDLNVKKISHRYQMLRTGRGGVVQPLEWYNRRCMGAEMYNFA